ncbi:MAG: hypothetical protein J2P37_20030 [Ktedonobacteraceae bacterium]|nr:hypothetical protein [Ktedonobacteraceae bacterium]
MTIPWCDSQSDFNNNHFITVTVTTLTGPTYFVWQTKKSDGDHIRCSTTGYQSPGAHIAYYSNVEGDRCLIVTENGLALMPFGDAVEIPNFPSSLHDQHMAWHHNPPNDGGRQIPQGQPGSGLEFLTFHCNFLWQFETWYNQQSFANSNLTAPWIQMPPEFRTAEDGPGRMNDEQRFLNNPLSWGSTEDAFGIWVENGIHSWLHTIAVPQVYGDPLMHDFMDASKSYYFYKLHGLINRWWITWQKAFFPGRMNQRCQTIPQLDAFFVSQTIPTTVTAGQTFPVSIRMQNYGAATWTSGGSNPFRLGSQNPQDNTIWGLGRVALPTSVPHRSFVDFNFTATAPRTNGNYHMQWQMLQELVSWFGTKTTDVVISVVGGKTKEGKDVKDDKDDDKLMKENDKLMKEKDDDFLLPPDQPDLDEKNLQATENGAEQSDADGKTFITADERPPVGQQALHQPDEDA